MFYRYQQRVGWSTSWLCDIEATASWTCIRCGLEFRTSRHLQKLNMKCTMCSREATTPVRASDVTSNRTKNAIVAVSGDLMLDSVDSLRVKQHQWRISDVTQGSVCLVAWQRLYVLTLEANHTSVPSVIQGSASLVALQRIYVLTLKTDSKLSVATITICQCLVQHSPLSTVLTLSLRYLAGFFNYTSLRLIRLTSTSC
jgi:DNA-directed RNA polymerase subunit RPC12/RpoP